MSLHKQHSLFLLLILSGVLSCSGPAVLAPGSEAPAGPADLVLRGGRVTTMNEAQPAATALAVRGERIVAVGTDADMEPWIGPKTSVIELSGRAVTPGLVDGHCHLYGLGAALESVSLRGATSEAEAVSRAANAAAGRAPGEWLTGRGWDQNLWTPAEFPDARSLDAAFPDRPVAMRRIDGHALWASGAAMKLAGISSATPDPPGGRIVRDAGGAPTGVFIDSAMALIESHIPEPDAAVRERRIERAAKVAVASGLTAVHEMGIDQATVAVYRDLAARGRLPLRVHAYLSGDAAVIDSLSGRAADLGEATGTAGESAQFSVRGVKLYADGALGSRGAAMLEPYSDDPQNRGLFVTAPADLERAAVIAAQTGWQLAIHAIGDAANRAVLDAYERAIRENPGADLRFRVEHVQVVAPDDLPRFARLGVIASMQPTHATSDMPWAEARVGVARIGGAYAWRTLLAGGAHLVAGSDFPVEEVSPLLGLYAAVTRRSPAGEPAGGWYPEQVMTLDEALRSFTVEPAFAVFVEHGRGRLQPGYIADITIYNRALVADESLLSTQIDMTVVGGRVVYQRP